MAVKRRRCEHCGDLLPAAARSTQKFCDAACRRGTKLVVDDLPGPVARATEESIVAAQERLTKVDAGAVAALRFLARKIDTELDLRDLALEYAAENGTKPPSVDNVSIPTYLKYCDALGLTPAGRARIAKETGAGGGSGGEQSTGGTLSGIRGAVPRPA